MQRLQLTITELTRHLEDYMTTSTACPTTLDSLSCPPSKMKNVHFGPFSNNFETSYLCQIKSPSTVNRCVFNSPYGLLRLPSSCPRNQLCHVHTILKSPKVLLLSENVYFEGSSRFWDHFIYLLLLGKAFI